MTAAEALAVASVLEDRAGFVEASADTLAARFATATWSGPAADRFRALMVQRRNDMRASADALREAAQALRMTAGSAP